MTSAPAAKFMAPLPPLPAALPWLEGVPQDDAPAWMKALRATAAEAFAATGLPTPKMEDWQYTNLRALAPKKFRYAAAAPDAAPLPAPLLANAARLVIVNGQYQPHLSAPPKGVTVMSLMEAAKKNLPGLEQEIARPGTLAAEPMEALAAAHLRDGFVLDVPAHVDVEQPVEVLFHNTGSADAAPALYPRVLYRLGENAGLTLIERHRGEGTYFTNIATDMSLGPAARLRFHRFMEESLAAQHISSATVRLEKGADFEGFCFATGAAMAREAFRFQLLNSVISVIIHGVYLIKGQQNHGFAIVSDHYEPEGKSGQYFKGVADDEGRAFFQGKTTVRRAAHGTRGSQGHHALLLSGQAEVSAKPELEIYTDDVQCSHGATSGHLDPAALFYLQSRGIPRAEAKALLVESFLGEAVDKVSSPEMKDIYRAAIRTWLEGRRG